MSAVKSKFKVGDRVRITDAVGYCIGAVHVGDLATVHRVNGNDYDILVETRRNGTIEQYTTGDDIELISDKFKPGDRVVRIDEWYGNFKKGDIGVVRECGGEDIYFEGDSRRYATAAFAAAPLFKVGDRVRALIDDVDITKGNVYTINEVDDDECEGLSYRVTDDVGDNWWMEADDVEAVAAAPTLRIEAGKFYKTRDGRKVGPMMTFGENFIKAEGDGYVYSPSGESLHREERNTVIIAEWDEPVAVAPATATKFKVGDRVVASASFSGAAKPGAKATVASRAEYWCGICKDTLVDVVWDKDESNGQSDGGYYIKDFELTASEPTNTAIVCILRDGNPLPASRPHVHQSVAEAKAEAERLARTSPGDTFAVYERVSSVSATVMLSEAA